MAQLKKIAELPNIALSAFKKFVGIDSAGKASLLNIEDFQSPNINVELDVRLNGGKLEVKWFSDDLSIMDLNPKIMLYRKKSHKERGKQTVIKFSHPSENLLNGDYYSGRQDYYHASEHIATFDRKTVFDLPTVNEWTELDFSFYDYFRPIHKDQVDYNDAIARWNEYKLSPINFIKTKNITLVPFNNKKKKYVYFKLKLVIDSKDTNTKQRIILNESAVIKVHYYFNEGKSNDSDFSKNIMVKTII